MKMKNMQTMNVKTFRKLGYLQELNRLFLHPHGLALSVAIFEDGHEEFGRIWDYRVDSEGVVYDDSVIDEEFTELALGLAFVFKVRAAERKRLLGYTIQPMTGED